MGIYSSSQFLGIFLGGAAGGWIYGKLGLEGVFGFTAVAAMIWFLVAVSMKSPRYLTSELLHVGAITEQDAVRLAARLTQVRGVAEAVVVAQDGIAYLKVDKHALDREELQALIPAPE